MKNLIAKLVLLVITIASLSQVALANVDIEELLPRPGLEEGKEVTPEELEAVASLPEITPEQAFTTAIKTILGWSMLLALIAIIVAAIYYLQSRGTEEDISKAKSIIIYLIIGMAIMAAAYGIIAGIAQFEFFQ